MTRRGYNLDFNEKNPFSGINFPDIIKLGRSDRDYELVADKYSPIRQVSKEELPKLEMRSLFYRDLSIPSFDEIFMDGKRDNWGHVDRPKSLVGMGAPKVLDALRTFTTDIPLINYRLDIQEDFQANPELVPAVENFYGEIQKVSQIHHDAYQRDYEGKRIRDEWNRWVYKNWWNLPRSFIVLDKAVENLQGAIKDAKSKGVKEVDSFLAQVKQHPTYAQWSDNISMLHKGGKYVVAFDFDINEGVSNQVELGLIPPNSEFAKIIGVKPNPDGEIPHHLDEKILIRRFSGLIKSDIGHVLENSLNLDFEGIPNFCKVLTEEMASQLSFYATLGKVYQRYEELGVPVCRPVFEGEGIEIRGAVHPVVAWQTDQKGENFILNDYVIDSKNNFSVLTGPNDGGKTCYGKTIALEIAMAQSGLMPTAKYVRIGSPVKDIYTHFVQQDDIEKGKGRHRNELSRARRICESITPQDFLLFDEPCGGTDSESGYRDSRSLIGYAHAIGLPTIFITHLHQLSKTVEEGLWPEIKNKQAEIIDGEKLTYKIVEGRAQHSYGSRISREEKVTPEALTALLQERISTGKLNQNDIRRKNPIF